MIICNTVEGGIQESILELYNSRKSIRVISKELGVTNYRVNKVLSDAGVKTRDLRESHRKHHYNNDVFKIIDNEEKAYWLGMLYADGNVCIKQGRKRIQLTLKNEDRCLLEKFLCFLGGGKIYDDRGKYSKIIAYNDFLADDLIKLGCIPNKSLTVKFPEEGIIPIRLMPHFIRGYFDGNGGISCRGKGYTLGVTGNKIFLQGLSDFLSLFNIAFTKFYPRYKDNPDSAGTIFRGETRDKYRFTKFMYMHSTIQMERKFNKIKSALYGHSF